MADGPVIIPDAGRTWWFGVGLEALELPDFEYKFRLFQNDEEVTLASEWSDFTEANFSGYAAADVFHGAQHLNGDGLWQVDCDPVAWVHDGGATANDIYGWLIVAIRGGPPTEIIFAGANYDPPRSMTNALDEIIVALNIVFDQPPPP